MSRIWDLEAKLDACFPPNKSEISATSENEEKDVKVIPVIPGPPPALLEKYANVIWDKIYPIQEEVEIFQVSSPDDKGDFTLIPIGDVDVQWDKVHPFHDEMEVFEVTSLDNKDEFKVVPIEVVVELSGVYPVKDDAEYNKDGRLENIDSNGQTNVPAVEPLVLLPEIYPDKIDANVVLPSIYPVKTAVGVFEHPNGDLKDMLIAPAADVTAAVAVAPAAAVNQSTVTNVAVAAFAAAYNSVFAPLSITTQPLVSPIIVHDGDKDAGRLCDLSAITDQEGQTDKCPSNATSPTRKICVDLNIDSSDELEGPPAAIWDALDCSYSADESVMTLTSVFPSLPVSPTTVESTKVAKPELSSSLKHGFPSLSSANTDLDSLCVDISVPKEKGDSDDESADVFSYVDRVRNKKYMYEKYVGHIFENLKAPRTPIKGEKSINQRRFKTFMINGVVRMEDKKQLYFIYYDVAANPRGPPSRQSDVGWTICPCRHILSQTNNYRLK